MYFHGGCWVLNDKESFDRLLRETANAAGAGVVFVEYSRSPEARYPVAIEEAYVATRWIAENGRSINLDPSRLAVVGDSSGGNMAAAVTLLARERRGPNIDFQILFSPTMDSNFDTPSYQEFATGYFLTREAMKWFWNHYAPDVAVREQVTAAPLKASVEQLKGLPSALGVRQVAALIESIRQEYNYPIFLNADHTHSLAKAEEAANARLDSIVFDRSELPFAENVSETRAAVEAIRKISPSILVEGEIGFIGSGSEIHERVPEASKILTTPETRDGLSKRLVSMYWHLRSGPCTGFSQA
jgi:acetyl esterase/lipase